MIRNCINVSDSIRIAVGTVGVVTSSLSLLGCLCAIAIIIVHKKYVFSIQRLFLYLAISVAADTVSQMVQRILLLCNSSNSTACELTAFINQYSVWAILISVCSVMFEFIVGIFRSFETGMKANLVYLTLIFIVPCIVNWVPFTMNAYGPVFWYCDIITHDKECNNYPEGIILISFLWWIPLYLAILFVILGYVAITVKLLYDKRRYTAMIELNRNQVYHNTYNDIMYLKYYPIIYMVINILPIASNLYDSTHNKHPFQPLWVVSALIKGLEGGFIAVVTIIDPKTRKRLTYKQLKAAFLQNVLRRNIAEEYPIVNGALTDSLHPTVVAN